MAQKGGKLKRFLLILIFLALVITVFVLLGGSKLLKKSGNWLIGVGTKAEDVKQTIEQKATTFEKKVEKFNEADKPGDKK
jgi:divalent metal cation (Fe/Co/Zn/Cd) transporter